MDGSRDRLRSRCRLAQAPHRPVAWLWLCKTLRSDPQTRTACRKHTRGPLRPVCREGTGWCQPLDRVAGARVALDGSQGHAVNAKARHVPQDPLTPLRPPRDQRVAGYRKALDGQDTHEEAGPPGGAGATKGQATIEALQHRPLLSTGFQAP
jgi:hypothetical protein